MPETLNEKALQVARDTVKTATAYNQSADISTVADIAIRAYLSSLPAGDYAGLIGRLTKRAHPMSTFGANLFNPDGEEAASVIAAQDAKIAVLVAELSDWQNGHANSVRAHAEALARAEAAEAEVKAMGEALSEVEGCFDAAFAEGLQERLNDEADRSLGTLYDLVTRRLLSAHDASRRARAMKEGE